MELFPLIKLSLIVFSILTGIVMVISYILYKIKNARKQSIARAEKVQQQKFIQQPQNGYYQPAMAQYQYADIQSANQHPVYEQQAQAQQRKRTVKIQPKVVLRPVERFQIVNQQQVDLRVQAIAQINKPFYHPRTAESKRQIISRKSFNLADNYSNGGEKLHKLNLAPNFS
ncbi:MAG: hypothetical protein LWX56_01690 [Ignavibacteria bacterium]|nr:hypothetical protein [Ignavibacteria bacterium]